MKKRTFIFCLLPSDATEVDEKKVETIFPEEIFRPHTSDQEILMEEFART